VAPYLVNARFAGIRMTGVQRSAYEIVRRLISDGSGRYHLVSPRSKVPPKGEGLSLRIRQRGRLRHGHLWEQIELPGMVRRMGGKAVLYSPMTSGPVAVKRQVVTAHDLFPVEHPEWFSREFSRWYSWLWPILLRRVARIVANSEYTRQRVLERYGLPEEKVVTCHFAHDDRFAPPPPEEAEWFRADRGLPESYLLYLGSVEPRKNLITLAAAWKRTSAREEGVKLVVAGGAARKAVFNAANCGAEALRDPTIHYLDYFSDEHLPLLYGGAEAFVLPSLAEGFGLPVLEAMACGTPVICSDTTALPEITGGAARLVPPLEVEAWTEAIDSVLSNLELRRRMGKAGTERASRFSWTKTAEAVRSLLEAV
jgi:glycosyltransferase involved in cell wall biosynthesis